MYFDGELQRFLSSLELTDKQSELAALRNNNLRDRLKQKSSAEIKKTLLIGSYERDTQIRPRITDHWALDVDALAILELSTKNIDTYFKNNDGGEKLLENFYQALYGFQGLEVEKDTPAITVKWMSQKMKVEIVPAFEAQGGGFLIPNYHWWHGYKWIVTNPLEDAKLLSKANINSGGELKPFIKSLKCWNRKEDKILTSFGIEALAFKTVGGTFNGFLPELQSFFETLLQIDGKKIDPPSGLGDSLFVELGSRRSRVERSCIIHSHVNAVKLVL